ncbi:hypothetical protein WA1_37020 [Scytonema hofmannii PCC 7110]|uniref:Uncharacterized protein n=1 Tax=Scytonema hofmannii PCC 7110 TaxID=128403 RepID=A0A139X118_9CYAN|nr:hypothetical protein [Scytonema hofmannii]KYC38388.1 hypothetical protein WA1_37020 [Scytonema hofmannii PCC 7110]
MSFTQKLARFCSRSSSLSRSLFLRSDSASSGEDKFREPVATNFSVADDRLREPPVISSSGSLGAAPRAAHHPLRMKETSFPYFLLPIPHSPVS